MKADQRGVGTGGPPIESASVLEQALAGVIPTRDRLYRWSK
jgi:hypothetical protein